MELYVHLPFCRSKCRYCDFASWAGQEHLMPDYVDAVLCEAMQRARELGAPSMDTAFLGGGTPSTLPPPLLEKLIAGMKLFFTFMPDAEFTSEANPGTLTAEWLDTAVACGVNRLSMGVQALQPELLRMLGRIHTFRQAEESARMARTAGIRRLSVDLMFGLPGQTPAMWRETLEAALSLGAGHISCYGLIPEEGTPLEAALRAGELTLPDEDEEREMYDDAIRILAEHGLRQYEISNFALPGEECRHNIGYWRQVPYVGLGASAASMTYSRQPGLFSVRSTNPRGIEEYLAMTENRTWSVRETEEITAADARFETMMLGLRMNEGVAEKAFEEMHRVSLEQCYGEKLRSLSQRGLLRHEAGRWFLTRRGMDIQNSILVELMED